MSSSPSLSVVIVAKNEAHNIEECVSSARFASEVLVLDSGSTDATAELARRAGARVVLTDWPGYGPQVRRAIQMARSDWVLSLDADERITPTLRQEILQAIASGAHDGWRIPRLSEFCGRFIHHGGWRPDATLRLCRRSKAGFTDHVLHAHMTIDGSQGALSESLVHYSYPDLSDVLAKLDRYSSAGARDMQAHGRHGGIVAALLHGAWAFVRTYVLRLGFLDRGHGLMLAIYNAEYAYYKYLKLMFLERPAARPALPEAATR